MPIGRRLLVLLVSACALAGAGALAARSRRRPEPAPSLALQVDVAGCTSFQAPARCEAPLDATLSFWVSAPTDAQVELATSGGAIRAAGVPVGGGTLYRVAPGGAREVRVVASRAGASVTWSLAVERAEPVAWLDEARELRARGKIDEARERISAELAGPSSAQTRARALGLLARIDRSRGALGGADAELRQALALDRSLGLLSEEANDSFALAYILARQSHRYAEARAVLDSAGSALARYAEGRAKEPYYRGLIAMETGDARQALRDFRRATGEAERLGLDLDAQRARGSYALELELVGRWRDALAELHRLESEATSAPPCDRVSYAINLGYGALLASAASERSDGAPSDEDDPIAPLERALALQAECPDAHERSTILANLALAELGRGAVDAARGRLEAANASAREISGSLARSLLEIGAELALRGRDPARALDEYDREAMLAGSAVPEAAWQAAFGRGEALRAMGRAREARDAYARAEGVLDGALAMVPLGEGRSAFLVERDRSARALVTLDLALGDVEGAAAAARHALARMVASMTRATQIAGLDGDARARWEAAVGEYRRYRDALDDDAGADWGRSKRELVEIQQSRSAREATLRAALEEALSSAAALRGSAERPPDEVPEGGLDLIYFRAEEGLVAFASARHRTHAVALGAVRTDAPPEALAARVLEPLRSWIEAARTIRIHADGSLWSRDLHALPFAEAPGGAPAPLESHALVEYAMGIDAAPRAAPGAGSLVVGDALGDLPSARAEAEQVARSLGGSGAATRLLLGSSATRPAVQGALASVDLFHFAGHGVFAGREGWDSVLPLAQGAHLSIADVLALPSVPRAVVLSACEGAGAPRDAAASDDPGAGVGIAHAFLAAGADVVVAAVRPIEDDVAAMILRDVYAHPGAPETLAEALRRSELGVRATRPAADWSAFRVLRR